MKSKYQKIKYTNTGVKASVVTMLKSRPELDRSDMIALGYEDMTIMIERMSRKTMYTRAQSRVSIFKDGCWQSFFVYDTINDTRVVCENLYLIIKKPELDYRITTREYDSIYEYMKDVIYDAKES